MARQHVARSAKEGLGFGILAGIIFALMEMLGAVLMGNPPLMPVRMFASVVLGQAAMETTSLGTALVVGIIAHLVLSAVFGLVYGLFNGALPAVTRASLGRQAALGIGFGAAVYLVDFQIIARILYPWFLMAPQFLQLMMHALFFGLPLGLMYAARERRVTHVRAAAPA